MENLISYKLFENNDEIIGVIEDILLTLKDDEIKIEIKIVNDNIIVINIGVIDSNMGIGKYRDELEMLKSYLEDTHIYKGCIKGTPLNIYNNGMEWEDIFTTSLDSVSLIFAENKEKM